MVVPIHSVSRSDHMMEGTRLTLVRVPNQPDAFEFSIRTPVTPPRWKDFDAELEAAFDGILQAFLEGGLRTGLRPLACRAECQLAAVRAMVLSGDVTGQRQT